MIDLTYKSLKSSRGSATKVAVLTVALAVVSVIIAFSVASGFRMDLTNAVISSEGDYWLECRDSSLLSPSPAIEDSNLIRRLYEYGATKVEGRKIADVVALTENGAIPLEFRSLSELDSRINRVAISESLHSKLGDTLDIIASMKIPFASPLKVDSVFRCELPELSGMVAYASSDVVAGLRGIDSDYVDGYVVWGADVEMLSYAIADENIWVYDTRDRFAGIFDWLDVIDGNVWLVVVIMMTVAAVNMLAALLSTILENTKTIAVLKSIGMPMSEIRRGVVMKSFVMSIVASVIGLTLAYVFCKIQSEFGIIRLSPDEYMLSVVPMHISLLTDCIIAVCTVILVTLASLLATIPVSVIKEDKILRYE